MKGAARPARTTRARATPRREFERMWGDGPCGAKDSHFGLGKGGHDAERISVGDVEVEVLFSPHPKRNASCWEAAAGHHQILNFVKCRKSYYFDR